MSADVITAIATTGTLAVAAYSFWYTTVGQRPVVELGNRSGSFHPGRPDGVLSFTFYVRNRRRHTVYIIRPTLRVEHTRLLGIESITINDAKVGASVSGSSVEITQFSQLPAGEYFTYTVNARVEVEFEGLHPIFTKVFRSARVIVSVKEYTPRMLRYQISDIGF